MKATVLRPFAATVEHPPQRLVHQIVDILLRQNPAVCRRPYFEAVQRVILERQQLGANLVLGCDVTGSGRRLGETLLFLLRGSRRLADIL